MNEVYVPVLHYFENGNSFTGSLGNMRFFLEPKQDQICASVWRGPFCMEKSQIDHTFEVALTAEGRRELQSWLDGLLPEYR